jgi:hypothetical protein
MRPKTPIPTEVALKPEQRACWKIAFQFHKHVSGVLPGCQPHALLTDDFFDRTLLLKPPGPNDSAKLKRWHEVLDTLGTSASDLLALESITGCESLRSAPLKGKLLQWVKRDEFKRVQLAMNLADEPYQPDEQLKLLFFHLILGPTLEDWPAGRLSDRALAEVLNSDYGGNSYSEGAIRKVRKRYGIGKRTKNGKAVRSK